ncbi:MAG TPA: hypothetical protein P5191_15875 [Ruminococcus sp.]|nr:hypothetical protein [Ruminococcus sp.]
MGEGKRKLPKVAKIILFLLLGLFIIAIAVVTDGSADSAFDLPPDSFSEMFHNHKKKENEENTEDTL